MGVYIPNMEKPKNAFGCSKRNNPDERMCIYTGKVFEETLSLLLDRPCDDCPLIEIPDEIWEMVKPKVDTMSKALKGWVEDFNATQHTQCVEDVGERRNDVNNTERD